MAGSCEVLPSRALAGVSSEGLSGEDEVYWLFEERAQGLWAVQRGQDQGGPLVLGLGVLFQAGQDEVMQGGVAQERSPKGVRPGR